MTATATARPWLIVATLLAPSALVSAAGPPQLIVAAHQIRTRVPGATLPLWDTTWWVTLEAAQGAAPLARIEFKARFTDESSPRAVVGGWDLAAADQNRVNGRVLITCPTRPDYDHHLRVQLRARDADGASSEWAAVDFPMRGQTAETAPHGSPPVSVHQPDDPHETLGTVEVVATDDMTIGTAKATLQRKAREKGGDTAVGFRAVSSDADRVTFAADVIRYVEAPPAVPRAVPQTVAPAVPQATPPSAASERVLGEISMPMERR